MVKGGGRIAFAHVEEIIDFPTLEGVRAYVESRENKTTFYLDKDNRMVQHFDEDKHVQRTAVGYTIKVWIPYNNLYMGC